MAFAGEREVTLFILSAAYSAASVLDKTAYCIMISFPSVQPFSLPTPIQHVVSNN
jgi:hypothetical protein